MKINFRSKKFKITAVAVFIIVLSSYLVFSHGGYKKYDSDDSFKVLMSVLLDTIKNKGEIELSENQINALGSSYFKDGMKKGSLTIQGLNMNIKDHGITILIPVKYKRLPLLLSTKGKFDIGDNEIKYIPDAFKVGKISLPKGAILNFINKSFGDKLTVKDDCIVIDKSFLPDDIESIEFVNKRLLLIAKEDTKEMLEKTNESIKKIEEQIKSDSKNQENKNVATNSGTKSASSEVNKTDKSNSIDKASKDETKQSLAQIAGELSSIGASSSKESEMLSIMSSTAGTLQGNPSYNFWGDVKRVMSIYKTLTPEEKKSFKAKVFGGVDMNNAMEIKEDYGM